MKHACPLLLFLCLPLALCAQSNPVPFVDQPMVPTSAAPGGVGFTLTVNGANFVSSSAVMWNGSARATHFVSPARLTATILASDIAKAGTASVTVVSPGAPASNVSLFSVVTPVAAPVFTGSSFPTFGNAAYVQASDFNGDGKLDLALSNGWPQDTVGILLGNGDGTFRPVSQYPANYTAEAMVTGDFNGDGVLDLVVVNEAANSVSVLLGNGDGTFRAPVSYSVSGEPDGLITGDFNRDGKLDLVVLHLDDANFSLLLGNGDGSFQPEITISDGGGYALCAGDFNGDGNLDVAISGSSTVQIFLGNGNGTFQPYLTYPAGDNLTLTIATSDVNGDGHLDLLLSDFYGVNVLLGNGDGSFGPPTTFTTTSTQQNSVAVADVNGDGKPDVLLSDSSTNLVAILLGNGDGTFQAASYFEGGQAPYSLAFGDFNGDGAMDFALSSFGDIGSLGGAFVSLQTNGPAVLLSPLSLAYPLQVYKTRSAPQTVQLGNVGKETLMISKIDVEGLDPKDFSEKNNCGTSLPVGASCLFNVIFDPTFKGFRKGAIVITDNAAEPKQSVSMFGTGTWVALSATGLNFGNQRVGSSSTQNFTVKNVGTGKVTVSSVKITGSLLQNEFSETNNCGPIAPGGSCTVSVTFAPTVKGLAQAQAWVHNDGGGRAQAVGLTGNGT